MGRSSENVVDKPRLRTGLNVEEGGRCPIRDNGIIDEEKLGIRINNLLRTVVDDGRVGGHRPFLDRIADHERKPPIRHVDRIASIAGWPIDDVIVHDEIIVRASLDLMPDEGLVKIIEAARKAVAMAHIDIMLKTTTSGFDAVARKLTCLDRKLQRRVITSQNPFLIVVEVATAAFENVSRTVRLQPDTRTVLS